jgi:iron complex outermembrane receptor protein
MKGSHRDYDYHNRISVAPVLKFQFSPNTSLTAEYTYQFNQIVGNWIKLAFSAKNWRITVEFTTAEPNMAPSNINTKAYS